MPKLGDYLGQLLSEISMARMQSDLEAIRIAEIYASHPLLRTLPIPHLRLSNVDLRIPVVVEATEEPREGESPRGGFTLENLRRKFDEIFDARLANEELAFSPAKRRELQIALDEAVAEHEFQSEASIDVYQIADALTKMALNFVNDLGADRVRSGFGAQLKASVRRAFLAERTSPPRLSVLVTTAEIREAGGEEVLTHLNLRVSEEGLEWTSIQSAGGEYERLVPE